MMLSRTRRLGQPSLSILQSQGVQTHQLSFHHYRRSYKLLRQGYTFSSAAPSFPASDDGDALATNDIDNNDHTIFTDIAELNQKLKSLFKEQDYQTILSIYKNHKKSRIKPTMQTFHLLFRSCKRMHEFDEVQTLLNELKENDVQIKQHYIECFIKCIQNKGQLKVGLDRILNDNKIPFSLGLYTLLVSKCGDYQLLPEALVVFDRLKSNNIEPNLVFYNCLLNAYSDSKQLEQALKLYEEMTTVHRIQPDEVTFNTLLNSCSTLTQQKNVYDMMVNCNIKPSKITYTTMVTLTSKLKEHDETLRLFREMNDNKLKGNTTIYNKALMALVRLKRYDDALELYKSKMKTNYIKRDIGTYNILLESYRRQNLIYEVLDLYNYMKNKRVEWNTTTFNLLILSCMENEKPKHCIKIYSTMCETGVARNLETYELMIQLYSEAGNVDKVVDLHQEIKQSGVKLNISIFNCILQAFSDSPQHHKFIPNVLDEIQRLRLKLNQSSYDSLIRASSTFDELDTYCEEMELYGIKKSLKNYNNILEMAVKLGHQQYALDYYEYLREEYPLIKPDHNTERLVIEACVRNEYDLDEALIYVNEFIDMQLPPNIYVYNSLLKCCIYDNDNALRLYNEMQTRYLIAPNRVTFNTLLQNCVSSGSYDHADKYIKDMLDKFEVEVSAYTAELIFTVYGRQNQLRKAKTFYARLKRLDIVYSMDLFLLIIKACSRDSEFVEDVIQDMSHRFLCADRQVFRVLFQAYYDNREYHKVAEFYLNNHKNDYIVEEILDDEALCALVFKSLLQLKELDFALDLYAALDYNGKLSRCNPEAVGAFIQLLSSSEQHCSRIYDVYHLNVMLRKTRIDDERTNNAVLRSLIDAEQPVQFEAVQRYMVRNSCKFDTSLRY